MKNEKPAAWAHSPASLGTGGLMLTYRSAVAGEPAGKPGGNFLDTASVHWTYGAITSTGMSVDMGHFRTASIKWERTTDYEFEKPYMAPALALRNGRIVMAFGHTKVADTGAGSPAIKVLPGADATQVDYPALPDQNDWRKMGAMLEGQWAGGAAQAEPEADAQPCP